MRGMSMRRMSMRRMSMRRKNKKVKLFLFLFLFYLRSRRTKYGKRWSRNWENNLHPKIYVKKKWIRGIKLGHFLPTM